MNPVLIYQEYFPQCTPSPFQQDLMEQTVKDLSKWKDALLYWAGNDYRPQSVLKLLGYYQDLVTGKQTYGKPKAAWIDVGRSVEEVSVYEPPLPCGDCGREICMKDHDTERRHEGT